MEEFRKLPLGKMAGRMGQEEGAGLNSAIPGPANGMGNTSNLTVPVRDH